MAQTSVGRRRITFTLNDAALQQLDELAKRRDRTRSWMLRKMVEAVVDVNEQIKGAMNTQ